MRPVRLSTNTVRFRTTTTTSSGAAGRQLHNAESSDHDLCRDLIRRYGVTDLFGAVLGGIAVCSVSAYVGTYPINRKLDEMRIEMKAGLDEMNAGLDELGNEMNTGLDELRNEMNTGLDELRNEIKAGFIQLESVLLQDRERRTNKVQNQDQQMLEILENKRKRDETIKRNDSS